MKKHSVVISLNFAFVRKLYPTWMNEMDHYMQFNWAVDQDQMQ